jgi:hypothetical protein
MGIGTGKTLNSNPQTRFEKVNKQAGRKKPKTTNVSKEFAGRENLLISGFIL